MKTVKNLCIFVLLVALWGITTMYVMHETGSDLRIGFLPVIGAALYFASRYIVKLILFVKQINKPKGNLPHSYPMKEDQ